MRLFAKADAKVAFSYQRARTQAEQLVNECGAERCHAIQSDLNTPASAKGLVAKAVERFGRLDILVANHGVWPAHDAPIDKMPDEQWRSTLSINLDAVFGLAKYAVAQMKAQARQGSSAGHIVLISSTSGQRGEAFHTDYSATKGALISMVKSLGAELARDRIYVNAVAPGWVDTDMSAATLADPRTGEKIRRDIPLGRAGTAEEIAGPVLFLCTEQASFITGEIFNVNGGAVLVG